MINIIYLNIYHLDNEDGNRFRTNRKIQKQSIYA